MSYGIDYNQFIADLINGWKYHNNEIDKLKILVEEQQNEIDEYKKIIQNYSETVLELKDSVNKLINKD